MTRTEIVAQLAKNKVVEEIVANIAKCHIKGMPFDMQDLCQMVYEILLTYNEAMICELWDSGEINYFIVRIIKNQYESTTSPFYREIKRFNDLTSEIEND